MIKRIRKFLKKSRLINNTYTKLYNCWQFLGITSGTKVIYFFSGIPRLNLFLTVRPYTMVALPRLSALHGLAERLEKTGVKGSFFECGVRNGGSAAVIAAAARSDKERHIWLFDSWEGFPEPDERDFSYKSEHAQKGGDLGYEERVKDLLFKRLRLDDTRIHLVKGWFKDTILAKRNRPIALLHLDCDLYESVKFCLEQLYDNVVQGGYIIIDDYGYWSGCKQAVDEFVLQKSLKVNIVRVDKQGVYFRK